MEYYSYLKEHFTHFKPVIQYIIFAGLRGETI